MLSYWEDILNKKSKGVTGLNLTTILETIGNDRDVFELNKELEQINRILHKKICDSCDEIKKLQMENEYLKQQNETLMELKGEEE